MPHFSLFISLFFSCSAFRWDPFVLSSILSKTEHPNMEDWISSAGKQGLRMWFCVSCACWISQSPMLQWHSSLISSTVLTQHAESALLESKSYHCQLPLLLSKIMGSCCIGQDGLKSMLCKKNMGGRRSGKPHLCTTNLFMRGLYRHRVRQHQGPKTMCVAMQLCISIGSEH